jgi:hypothetical protein
MDPLARMPYSVSRFLKLCKTWSFYSEAEDRLGDCDDGEPRVSRAHRRIREWLQQWRDSHDADADPGGDESLAEFHVSDVAIIFSEFVRLGRLEEQVIRALGPPTTGTRWNRKTRKLERWPDGDDLTE